MGEGFLDRGDGQSGMGSRIRCTVVCDDNGESSLHQNPGG